MDARPLPTPQEILDRDIAYLRNLRAEAQAQLDRWAELEEKLIRHAQEGKLRHWEMYVEAKEVGARARRAIATGINNADDAL